ncbi:hypothetical protein VTJ49DRAFT_4880 [Mycothermus thermophilus]|uniref:Uncharacterized protein n=1 Tax=Humicola insolens TaxID=85995 RepID=A0ABR3V4R3_HUMIN
MYTLYCLSAPMLLRALQAAHIVTVPFFPFHTFFSPQSIPPTTSAGCQQRLVTTPSGDLFALSTTPVPAGVLGGVAAGSQEASPRFSSELSDNKSRTPSPTPTPLRPRSTLGSPDHFTPRQDDRPPTASSHRTLRRTPRFSATPSPVPGAGPNPSPRVFSVTPSRRPASIGYVPRPIFSVPEDTGQPRPARHVYESFRRHLSQELSIDVTDDEEEPSSISSHETFHQDRPLSHSPPRPPPHPAARVSKHTKSAILWALEEALRKPHPFSPDLIEENASMADLLAGGAATTNGNVASSSRPTTQPAQTGSPQQVIRGPRMIMRERAEREARQRAEREQMERTRAEEEARLLEETQRRIAEQRQPAATPAAEASSSDPAAQRRQQRAQEAQASSSRVPGSTSTPQPSATVPPLRTGRVPPTMHASQNLISSAPSGANIPACAPTQTGETSAQGASGATRLRNTFPHAFERWEALSAHWEGMTSFWLRRLQENTDEAERNPISTQLSRQVADLSAAGANLFHAVVELQRLRASSERKFQRWFFETRSELERHQGINAMLEAQLEQERQARAEAARKAAQQEAENAKLQKMVGEMRRELLISKEEARRAWEELGRREQEERDRTLSLQQGQPTLVGGVQVVPMTHSAAARGASRHQRSQSHAVDTSDYVAAQTGHYSGYGSAVGPSTSSTTNQPGDSSAGYYRQQPEEPASGAGDHRHGAGSEAGYNSDGEYMVDSRGNYLRDEDGNRIPFHSPSASPSRTTRGRRADDFADDYDNPASSSQVPATSYPPSSSQWATAGGGGGGGYTTAGGGNTAEYGGQSYAPPGWETMPRHHHPTRLSDVIEEDERSRTSVSRV